MIKIKKIIGEITSISDLSKTAKEINIKLSEPVDFMPGSFVNIFMDINGAKVRRAYSIASSSTNHKNISIAVRLSPAGMMSKLFWSKNMIGQKLELMGPLGLNTVDKMSHKKIYLFAFGIGGGVVKSIAHHFSSVEKAEELVIITGSRSVDEIIYKDYFNKLERDFKNVKVMHVVSSESLNYKIPRGYIQDHIKDFDFNNSDVYVCGQEKACNDLIYKIKLVDPTDCNYFVEAFH